MSRSVSRLNNQTIKLPLNGLTMHERSQIESLNMIDQAEKIKKEFIPKAQEELSFCVALLFENRQRLHLLKTTEPNEKNEINRITNIISNLENNKSRLDIRLHNLELNLAERIAIMDELSKSGRTVLTMLPSVPTTTPKTARGKTKKRKKRKTTRKKRKTRRRK